MTAEQSKLLAETDNWSHVDKPQAHTDWEILYREIAPLVNSLLPSSAEVQLFIERHYSIATRFYAPSQKAYIGMGLFYKDNTDMNVFHNTYHPQMVEFLGEAIFIYAQRNL